MLIAVQKSGKKPPLFFVHGLHGVMPLGQTFLRVLGPDQPLYAVHANGIDGRQPTITHVRDMVQAYVAEIHAARPMGRILIGGMCSGGLAAVEIARDLQEKGRQVGPVILADPPPMPFGFNEQQRAIDPGQPQVARQLYGGVRKALFEHASRPYNDMPFDAGNSDQLHIATLAGVSSLIAFAKYVPHPYLGPAQLIVSDQRAAGFFHPQMPWSKLLAGPRMVHVLPWEHEELLRSGREHVARAIKLMLQEAPTLEVVPPYEADQMPV